jgi:hypothetical protein
VAIGKPGTGSASDWEEDAVAGADDLDRAVLALAQADAFGDEDRLAVRVGVPGGAGAGGEVHACGGECRGAGRCGDGVDVDVSGEPVRGAFWVSMLLRVICMMLSWWSRDYAAARCSLMISAPG